MTPQEAKKYIDSFINYELKIYQVDPVLFKLDRVKRFLALLGNPDKQLKFIHVAGTNGKGSSCAFIATILKEAGFTVGLYTSPHLDDYRERIRILGREGCLDSTEKDIFNDQMKENELCECLEELKPYIEIIKKEKALGDLTFFEILTVLAIWYFKKRKADFVVLETGLGGRLDATNAVESLVCALTPIGLEHTKQLGCSLEKIAFEKAAIIKRSNQTVVVAPQENIVKEVINKRSLEIQANPLFIDEKYQYRLIHRDINSQAFELITPQQKYLNLKMKLLGDHQIVNACVAIGVIEALQQFGYRIHQEAIQMALLNTFWPGRFEVICNKPLVIIDGAHNPDAMEGLVKILKEFLPLKKKIFILGVSKDKDYKSMFHTINQAAFSLIITKANHPRACTLLQEELGSIFLGKEITYTENMDQALKLAFKKTDEESVVVITGSIFLIAEARNLFKTKSLFETCIN